LNSTGLNFEGVRYLCNGLLMNTVLTYLE